MIVVVNSPSEAAVRVRTVVAQALGGELTSQWRELSSETVQKPLPGMLIHVSGE